MPERRPRHVPDHALSRPCAPDHRDDPRAGSGVRLMVAVAILLALTAIVAWLIV